MVRWFTRILITAISLLLIVVLLLAFMPTRWLADKIEVYASELLEADLKIGALELNLLSFTPSAELENTQLRKSPHSEKVKGDSGSGNATLEVGNVSVSVDLHSSLRGELVIDQLLLQDAVIDLAIDEAGNRNWSYLVPAADGRELEDNSVPPTIPTIRSIKLGNVKLLYEDLQNNRRANLLLTATGSTVISSQPAIITATGVINGLDSELDLELMPSSHFSFPLEAIDLKIASRFGHSEVSFQGTVGDPVNFKNLDIQFSVVANGLEDFQLLSGIKLPTLLPFSINGDLLSDDDQYVLKRFDGFLGDSDIEGDIRVNPSTSPITLFANIISRKLDLDDLAGLVGGTPNADETATDKQKAQAQVDAADPQLLPDRALNLRPMITMFNGAVRYRAESVSSPVWPLNSIDIRAEISGKDVVLAPLNIGLAGGSLDGTVYLDLAARPMKSKVELQVKRVNLKQLMSSVGVDDDSFGKLGGSLKYWVSGESIAEMAASADGGIFLLMTDGKLDALITELVGIDLTESLILLIDPGKTRTKINCAYLDMHSRDGVTEISTLVMDTADSVLLAAGSIDLNDESLDITVEPHPKDASILAAQTAAYVSGTLKDITVLPGKSLYARAAAAALLAAIATPAAALIPFIEAGTGEDSPYCSGMIKALDDAR